MAMEINGLILSPTTDYEAAVPMGHVLYLFVGESNQETCQSLKIFSTYIFIGLIMVYLYPWTYTSYVVA